jgi:predicted nucleic acid-binding protein
MVLLDTNVISELRRPGKANPKVAAWADTVRQAELFLSAITILEIEIGILQLERRDQAQSATLRTWMDSYIRPAFDGRILPVDLVVALRCAQLHVPDRRSDRDAMIAATALVHDLTIVSRNVADFQGMRADLINPWD